MRKLLERKADLERQLDEVIRTTDHSSSEDRFRMIEKGQPLLGEMQDVEDVLGRQRAELGRLIQDVLVEVDSLAEQGSHGQIRALLGAVGDLPLRMFDQRGFAWDELCERFKRYQQHYECKHDYVRALDEIRSIG